MTEDQQDIEQIEEQSKPKFKTSLVKNIVHFILLWLLILGSGSFFIFNLGSGGCGYSDESLSRSLHQSLQSAAAIYVAQQRTAPIVFSDFVVSDGVASEPVTLSLDNVDATAENLDTKEMKLTFESGDVAIYHLENTIDVSLTFKDKEKEKQSSSLILFPFIITFVITVVVFTLLRILFKNYIVEIISCLIILMILAAVVVPKYAVLTKPAIYLYPTEPTMVNVKIDEDIDLSLDIPKYPPGKGWNVFAQPDGKIIDLQLQYTDCNKLDPTQFGMEYAKEACLGNNYPYLYWEGTPKTKHLPPQTKGWLVKMADIKEFLNSKLDYVGFNKAEKDEFIRYWVHKITSYNKESVFISFMQTESVDAYHSMTITPAPDSINRFYIIVDFNVNNHIKPKPQKLKKFKREGFTVVDWGGAFVM